MGDVCVKANKNRLMSSIIDLTFWSLHGQYPPYQPFCKLSGYADKTTLFPKRERERERERERKREREVRMHVLFVF